MPKPKYYFPNDKATNEWLDSYRSETRSTYVTYWRYFLEFTGMTGDQILESRKANKEYAWEKKVLEFNRWMIEKKGQAEKSASTAASMVRGFFSYYRLTLQFRRSESAQMHETKPKYEDYRFSKEDLKKMFDVGDLVERYILTAGKSFGLRAGDFTALTRGDFEPYLDRLAPISLSEHVTQKESVKAYPFIDSDALPVIKLMIEKMNRENRMQPTERILTYSHEIQLSRVLNRLADKAGIKHGDKRVRFHCLRKFLIDRLSSVMSESKWKQIVGKKISEGAYVSPDSLREDYMRVTSETCFTKPTFEGDIEKQIQKQALLAVAKTMGITEEQLHGIFSKRTMKIDMLKRRPMTIDDELKILEKAIEEKRRKSDTDCADGVNCGESDFKQIGENELLAHLRKGWQIVHKLGNGDLVIRRS
jgi:integrase